MLWSCAGYYRVNYDESNWELLASHLLHSPPRDVLSAATRAQLLDDALNLARAGILGYDIALNMTRYLATRENHYVPWKAFLENVRFLDRMLRQTTAYGSFQVLEAKCTPTLRVMNQRGELFCSTKLC
jgi:aminopeptidase N